MELYLRWIIKNLFKTHIKICVGSLNLKLALDLSSQKIYLYLKKKNTYFGSDFI